MANTLEFEEACEAVWMEIQQEDEAFEKACRAFEKEMKRSARETAKTEKGRKIQQKADEAFELACDAVWMEIRQEDEAFEKACRAVEKEMKGVAKKVAEEETMAEVHGILERIALTAGPKPRRR